MRLNPGKLKHRIEIVAVKKEQNENGFWTNPVDVPVHDCWAQFTRLSGKEMQKNSADYGEISARFLIRWTPRTISRKMVVRYAGERYEIQYINNYSDSRDFVEIIATLQTKGG